MDSELESGRRGRKEEKSHRLVVYISVSLRGCRGGLVDSNVGSKPRDSEFESGRGRNIKRNEEIVVTFTA